jgi:ATP/ADP translocase
VAFSFFAAKVMDYSIRNVLNEMIYVPLDFDSRYLGKEVIGVFGNRFGKSGISLVLSGLGYAFGSFGAQELSRLTAVASLTWFSFAFRLSNCIPRKDEATDGSTKKEK